MKRIAGVILLIAGLVIAGLGLYERMNQEEQEPIAVTVAPDSTFVYTAPGVLSLLDPSVKVTAEAEGENIQWAVGKTADVEAWIGDSTATKITGLANWEEAATEMAEGTPEAAKVDAETVKAGKFGLIDSDMWLETGTGEGTVSFDFKAPNNVERSLILTTESGKAPQTTLEWDYMPEPKKQLPIIPIGILLGLIGLFFLLKDQQDRAVERKRKREADKDLQEREAMSASETQVLPKFTGDLADPETGRETQKAYTAGAYGASVLPPADRSAAFRNRELAEADRLTLPVVAKQDPADALAAHRESTEAAHGEATEASQGALGALVLPDTKRAAEFRQRELADEDRLLMPADSEKSADAEPAEVTSAAEVPEPAESSDESEVPTFEQKKDWRDLWDFKWASPWAKEEDDDA